MVASVRFPELVDGTGELRLEIAPGVGLEGTSIGTLATAFAVDALKTAVDMGRCSALLAAQETVLLTHCHSDHVAGLVAWLSAHTRRHLGSPTRIVVPGERRQPLLEALRAWPDLDGVRRRVDLDQVLAPAQAGELVELAGGGWARAFAVRHSVPTLGWIIGSNDHPRPLLVFCGDGTVEPFEDNPALLDAAAAVVDCSQIEPGTRVAARLGGHGHLRDWLDLEPRLACGALVLAHLPVEATAARLLELTEVPSGAGAVLVPWLRPPPGVAAIDGGGCGVVTG